MVVFRAKKTFFEDPVCVSTTLSFSLYSFLTRNDFRCVIGFRICWDECLYVTGLPAHSFVFCFIRTRSSLVSARRIWIRFPSLSLFCFFTLSHEKRKIALFVIKIVVTPNLHRTVEWHLVVLFVVSSTVIMNKWLEVSTHLYFSCLLVILMWIKLWTVGWIIV
jgi:hypothetical protein